MKTFQYWFIIIGLAICTQANSQSCTAVTNSGNNDFFTFCQPGSSYTLTGDYTITLNNNSNVLINGNVTIIGTLTINILGSAGSFVQVQSPFTLTATNLTFTGSGTTKSLVVDGPSAKVVVSGVLNFGGLNLAVDTNGTPGGSISAGSITGGGNTTCATGSNLTCPTFTVTGSCSPAGSGICSPGSGLPVTLLDLSASSKANKVELRWATASELNFDYFDIQRSSSGIYFRSIGQVTGNGTTNKRHDYLFEDESPLIGTNYYRLKSVDFDGYTEYFDIISVEFSDQKRFTIFPNPNNGKSINSSINFNSEQEYTLTIMNNFGAVIGRYPSNESELKVTFKEDLPRGVYHAKLSSPDYSKTVRFVVVY